MARQPEASVHARRSSRALVRGARLVLPLVVIACFASPARGWPIPGMLIDDPQAPHERTFCKPSDTGAYQEAPHAYIIERAGDVLRADGHTNWASGVTQFEQHLFDGCMVPDRAGPDLLAIVSIYVVPIPVSVTELAFRICNTASMDHYYNPDTGKGLHLVFWQKLEKMLKGSAPLLSQLAASMVGLDGLVFSTVDIEPDLKPQYPSVVDRCAEHLEKAVSTWRALTPAEPTRSYQESAMLHLGMACHYLADCAVAHHTWDCFLGNHSAYEEEAVGKGDDDAYHAKSGGVYAKSKLSPKAFARQHAMELAGKVHGYAHFQEVEGQGASTQPGSDLARTIAGSGPVQFEKALKFALPLAERYTAGLIARFFQEVGVHPTTPPLSGYVRGLDGEGIAGAYLFYRRPQYPLWQVTRTDRKGRYTLIDPAEHLLLRPAMPGFEFEGKALSEIGGGGEAFHTQSPFFYTAPTNTQFSAGGDLVSFILTPRPTELRVSHLLDPKDRTLRLQQTAHLAPHDLRVRRAITRAPRLNLQATVPPGTVLTKAGETVSAGQSERVMRGLLQTTKLSARTLGAKNAQLLMAPFVDVELRVHHYVDLGAGKIVTTGAELVQAMDRNRTLVRSRIGPTAASRAAPTGAMGTPPTPDPQLIQALKLLDTHAGPVTVTRSDGSATQALRIPSTRDPETTGVALLDYGLVPVPATAGVALEAAVVPSHGYLGSALASPLKLVTDATGRIAFRVHPGTNGGKLRLVVRVTNDPLVSYTHPVLSLELLVHPRPGADPKTHVHPKLASRMPKELLRVVPPKDPRAPVARTPDAGGVGPVAPKAPDTVPGPPQPADPGGGPSAPPQPDRWPTAPAKGGGFHVQVVRMDDLGVLHPVPGVPLRVLRGRTAIATHAADAQGGYLLELPSGASRLELTPAGYPRVLVDVRYDARRQVVHAERIFPTHRDLFDGTLDVRYRVILRADPPRTPDRPPEGPRPIEPTPTRPPEPAPPEPERQLHVTVRVVEHDGRTPARGAAVEIVRGEDVLARGEVGEDGTWTSTALARGPYHVVAERHGTPPVGRGVHLEDRDVVVTLVLPPSDPDADPRPPEEPRPPEPVPPEEPPPPADPRPGRQATLDVFVFAQGARGLKRPLPGPQVQVLHGGRRVAWGRTNERGHFRFRLPPGEYEVRATHPDHREGRAGVRVTREGARREIVLQPLQQAPPDAPPQAQRVLTIRVLVTDGRSPAQPAPGARVRVFRGGREVASGKADAGGLYRVRLAAGPCRVEAELLPRFQRTNLEVRVGNQDLARDVVLRLVDIR